MLTAIIKKLTGLNATEYLTPRLYEPLGIAVPRWEKTVTGVEVGGWGLDLKTEDQAKLMQCYLDDGKYDGKQVIPAFWAKTAGEQHVKKRRGFPQITGRGTATSFGVTRLKIPTGVTACFLSSAL
jgi:CubicO group peptidase (beta-lactamase class C family)